MPTVGYIPTSCRVQDFLNALSASMNKPFTLVGPDGKAIIGKLADIPMVGLTTKEGHPSEPFGFRIPRKGYDLSAPSKFDADAILVLDVKPEELPKELAGLQGTVWLMALTDDSLLEYYTAIATKLDEEFKNLGVTIVVKPDAVTDDDTKHEFPTTGPLPVCHIIPHEK